MGVLSRHVIDERERAAVAKQHKQALFEELTPIVERSLRLFMKVYYGVQRPELVIDRSNLLWSNAFCKVKDDSISVTFCESPDRFRVTISWYPNANRGGFTPKSVSNMVRGRTRDHLEKCLLTIAQKRGLRVL